MADQPKTTLTDGSPVTPDHRELKPNGQQKGYVVLSAEERAKGFVRPVRRTYVHAGVDEPANVRMFDDAERAEHAKEGYVAYQKYPETEHPVVGRYLRQDDLQARPGCGQATTMSQEIAETYARNPKFYGGTFCVGCGKHLPLREFRWGDDGTVVGS